MGLSSGTGAATTLCRRTLVPRKHGDNYCADQIPAALSGYEEALGTFLVSNELWGGSGSIADQALHQLGRPMRSEAEALLADGNEIVSDHRTVDLHHTACGRACKRWQIALPEP